MKTISNTLLVASLCLLTALPVHAGRVHNDDCLMNRMERQHDRIHHGVRSGSLDHREVRKLRKDKRRIHRLARQFNEDDLLTGRERRILRTQLNQRSERIRKFKHNDRYRHAGRYAVHDDDRNHRYRERDNRRHQRDDHYRHGDDVLYWSSGSEEWPRYGLLYW